MPRDLLNRERAIEVFPILLAVIEVTFHAVSTRLSRCVTGAAQSNAGNENIARGLTRPGSRMAGEAAYFTMSLVTEPTVRKPSGRDLRRNNLSQFPRSLYYPVAFPTGLTIQKRLGNTNLFIHPRPRRHRQLFVERSSWQSAFNPNLAAASHIGVLHEVFGIPILQKRSDHRGIAMWHDRVLIRMLGNVLSEPSRPISRQSFFLPTRARLKSSVKFQQMTGHAVALVLNRLHVGTRPVRVMTIAAPHLNRLFLRS